MRKVRSPDGDLEEAVLPDVRLGQETRASFTAKRETTGILTMHAEGPSFDARGVLTNLFSGKAAPTSGTVDEGDRTTLQDVEGEQPTNLALTARYLPAQVETPSAHGQPANVSAQQRDTFLVE